MSDSNRGRSDDLQDYLDLLEAYANKKDNKNSEEKEKSELDGLFDDFSASRDEDLLYEQVLKKHRQIEDRKNPEKDKAEAENEGESQTEIPDEAQKTADEEAPKKASMNINIDYSLLDEDPAEVKSTVPPMVVPQRELKGIRKFNKWYRNLPKGKRIAFSIISIILIIAIILVAVAGIFLVSKLSLIKDANDLAKEDTVYEDPNYEDIEIDIGSSDFKQALIDWATTGNDKHMYSKNVINVLLIGADSRDGTNSGNTDVMMLLSLNKKTKQLKICSLFRDSYLYIEGKNSSYCTKLNAAYSMGGPECLMQTIENNYKIEIDNYVMVNFETFEKIIDEMGGVTVEEVKQYEADEIVRYSDGSISPPVGQNVTLDGAEALMFCRIRKCDSDGDVSRTRRQRMVIESIIDKVLSASITNINKYIDILLPYVKTGYTNSEIISLGLRAVTGGWAMYDREQIQVPSAENRTSGDANMWIWVVDYQKAAYDLQMALYGQSNIVIKENRVSLIDVYNGATYSGGGNDVVDNNVAYEPEVTENTAANLKPTETTTEKPTEAPTDVPTDVPSDIPTDEPLDEPTDEPLDEPTEEPTQAPTDAPTDAPVEEPAGNEGEGE